MEKADMYAKVGVFGGYYVMSTADAVTMLSILSRSTPVTEAWENGKHVMRVSDDMARDVTVNLVTDNEFARAKLEGETYAKE